VIIVSITGPTMSDALAQVASSDRFADAFEFRLDLIRAPAIATLMLSTRSRLSRRADLHGRGEVSAVQKRKVEILSSASLLGRTTSTSRWNFQAVSFGIPCPEEGNSVILSRHLPKGQR